MSEKFFKEIWSQFLPRGISISVFLGSFVFKISPKKSKIFKISKKKSNIFQNFSKNWKFLKFIKPLLLLCFIIIEGNKIVYQWPLIIQSRVAFSKVLQISSSRCPKAYLLISQINKTYQKICKSFWITLITSSMNSANYINDSRIELTKN